METKKPWQSKTNWLALISAAASFFPPVQEYIAQNPETYATVLSIAFMILRQITKDKIAIK